MAKKTGAKAAKERRKAGKCSSCGKPAVRGGRCERHWLVAKEQAAAKYRKRKRQGMCGMCGERKPEKGKKCCRTCLDKQNKDRRIPEAEKRQPFDKPWHVRNSEAGYCTLGGAKHARPTEGHTLCDKCLAKKRKRARARVKAGVCISHPDRVVAAGRQRCQECLDAAKTKRDANITAGLCAECGNEPPELNGKLGARCLAVGRIKDKSKRARLRRLVQSKYGDTLQCVCCHEGNPDMLELDHIAGDGAAHRREIGGKQNIGGTRMLYWLKKHNFPPGLQLACATCNKAKHRHGACPHQHLPPDLLQALRDVNERIALALRKDDA